MYGPFRRRRLLPSLLVPRDVVLLRELVGEIAEVVEAEPRPAVQQENRRPAAGAATRDQRPVIVRGELGPRHAVIVSRPRRNGYAVRRRFREDARRDDDFAAVRDDPRFEDALR